MHKLKRIIKTFARWCPVLIKYILGYISLQMFHRELLKKDIWLISEKRGEARDNGYHLYKYIRTNHPEINAYYVIMSGSQDYKKVSPFGNLIELDSKEHMLYYLAAKYSINSQTCGAYPYIMIPEIFRITKIFRNPKQKCVFLQHGITKDAMPEKNLFYETGIIDLFVSAAKREKDFIIKQYGYPEVKVPEVGFCRFDNLNNHNLNIENIVLVMPTWRRWLKTIEKYDEFLTSEYCEKYVSLLKSEKIAEILCRYGYKLVFYPHHGMQGFLECFAGCANERIIIASKDDYDVQDLLIRSKVLITDFSSVYFDFAYMGKPVIYYQFDEEKFFAGHYQRGYFSYRRDGFGNVTVDETELLDELEAVLERGCVMEAEFCQRREAFFDLIDAKNCERNFNAILSLEGRDG